MSIIKMKRLRFIGMRAEREELLRQLQHLGCVEIDEPGEKLIDPAWAALVRPDTRALAAAKETHASATAALAALKKYAPVKGGLLTRRPVITEGQLFDDGAYSAAKVVAGQLNELERRISTLYAEQSKLKTQKIALSPWLGLDIPLETASTRDVSVIFGTVAAAVLFETMEREVRATAELAQIIRAGSDQDLQYFVLVCHKSAEEGAMEALKQHGFSRTTLRGWTGTAAENNRRLDAELAQSVRRLEETRAEAAAFADKRGGLALCLDRAFQEIAREESKSRLLDTGTAFFLEGWVPAPDEAALMKRLEAYTCCWETEDPLREDYPKVPIKLKSNVFTEPLNMITEMYSLPAYDGVDPNPLIAPFYIFFFGFMFADLAYGIILASVAAFATFYLKPKGGTGQLMRLMIECGISSAIIGFLTGGFFSDAISRFCGIIGAPVPQIPFLTVNPIFDVMKDPMTVLIITLAIGMVQILFGMAVKAFMLCRDGHPLDALFDVGSWWLLFGGVAVGAITGIWYVAFAGVAALILTQGRNNAGNLFMKLFGGVASLYDITGYFGDILSYSRLMVMMLAGSVIGQVFNILGAMPGNVFVFIVIFIIGHVFNMGLNVIGTYVHTSRLQYLEFFGKFYKEGGRPFKPLNVNTKYVDIVKEEH